MDQAQVASIRKGLESRSTEELLQALDAKDGPPTSPEELEAIRQLLGERRSKGNRAPFALASAVLFGALAGAGTWWQGVGAELIVLACAVGAILGFASWYVRDLIPKSN
jgi:hypothetical protein